MRFKQLTLRTNAILFCATAVPLCFAGNLSFLNDTAVASLTDADRKLQLDAARAVLESPDATSSAEWSNPDSGSSGRVQSLGNLESEDGLHCREVRLYCKAKGVASQFAFPVCKDPKGDWFIASGKKLKKV